MQTPANAARPINPEAQAAFLKGLDSIARGQKLEAARSFHQAVRAQPDYFDALFNLGLALQELGQLPEACACYEQATRLRPDYAPLWNNLGVAQKKLGQWGKAVAAQRQAVCLEPGNVDFQNNLAVALRAGGQAEEAIQVLQQALQAAPHSAMLWHSLGQASRDTGRLEESAAAFQRAIEIDPQLVESHWDLGFTLLMQGDFPHGWKEYEWRWKRKDFPPRAFAQPAWQGEDLAGKLLLVHAEQGAGDAIQFARYVPLLAQRGARVVLECSRPLVPLMQTLSGVEQVIVKGDALPPFDLHCALLSLPRLFRTTMDTIPSAVPYVRDRTDGPRLPAPARASTQRQLRIGLAWAGNPEQENDVRRSIPFEVLRPWLANTDAVFYSLQVRPGNTANAFHQTDDRLVDLSPLIKDYADTVALISQLDLVISVDTSVAHLAGALGHTTWVMLCYAPDWRWFTKRSDNPWYPGMRVFRQPAPGDWNSVLKKVAENLKTFPTVA